MPRINVVGQKFLAKLNNGDNYDINDTTDFSQHLKGGVLEEIKAIFNVQVSWDLMVKGNSSLKRWFHNSVDSTIRLTLDGVDFNNEGFSVGDNYKFTVVTWAIEGTVLAISEGQILLHIDNFTSGSLSDGFAATSEDGFLTGTTLKTALKYDFGLIENNEPINFLSKLTNTNQTYLFEGIDHANPLTFVDGVTQGNNKAPYTGSSKVAFVKFVPDNDQRNTENTTQEFQIEHIFKINPIYRDGEIDSLKGIDSPPTDIFKGDMSLKYVFQSEFRTVLNNPNTSMISSYDTQLGSVGYLDESFNGYASDYSIEDLTYLNVSDNVSLDKLDIDKYNRVTFNIKSENGNIDTNTPLIIGHTSIVDSLAYSNSTKDYSSIWLDQNLRTTEGASNITGDIILNYSCTRIDNNTLSVSFDLLFSSDDKKQLSDGQDYLLYFTIGDPTKTVDEGSKVTGRIDVNYYDKSSDIAGLFDVTVLDQYPIPYEFDKGVSTGFTSGKMFIEDEQFCYARFKVLDTYLGESGNLTEDVTLESLKFKIVAYNTVDNTWFDLRSLSIDLSDQVVSGNIQSIALDTTRGYILTDTDIFNSLKLTTDTNDGTYQFYDLEIGYKIPWQDWLSLPDADTIFLDRAKDQNGLNQNASNYSFTNNYVIKFLIDADVETTGITTNEVKRTGDFLAYNRNTDDQEPDAYSCVINTFKEDGTPILNNVIQKGFTELRAVITPVNPPVDIAAVDMTEVANVWNRFAHGNKLPLDGFPRLGDWNNEQANESDTFSDSVTDYTKLDGTPSIPLPELYGSTPTTINALANCFALYGCYSLLKYEFYSITGTMFSTSTDNDAIVYNIAFMTDEDGVEHTLSLAATSGGWLLDTNPLFEVGNDSISSLIPDNTFASWALVYDLGKRGGVQLDEYITSSSGLSWVQAGGLDFDVSRVANNITASVDWDLNGSPESNTFNYDLNSSPLTQKFIGVQNIGFSFISQDQGGFKDVVLSNPSDGYYGVLRMETKDSPSDFGKSELNTEIVNTNSSLLKQITGDENKALLSYDGTDFIIQGLVETENTNDGEEYTFSAELRRKDLIL